MVSPVTFALLDTIVRFAVLVGLGFLIRFVVKGLANGFPPLADPDHHYAEAQVHAYGVASQYDHWKGTSGIAHFHTECANEYLSENLKQYQYFEVWLKESNIKGHCEHCE